MQNCKNNKKKDYQLSVKPLSVLVPQRFYHFYKLSRLCVRIDY